MKPPMLYILIALAILIIAGVWFSVRKSQEISPDPIYLYKSSAQVNTVLRMICVAEQATAQKFGGLDIRRYDNAEGGVGGYWIAGKNQDGGTARLYDWAGDKVIAVLPMGIPLSGSQAALMAQLKKDYPIERKLQCPK